MSMKTSVLVPLGQKTKPGGVTSGILNNYGTTSLSSTPSPVATPLSTQSISSFKSTQLPSLSPAPSPASVSSSLVGSRTLPLGNSSTVTPSTEQIKMNNSVQPLSRLSKTPPSPRLPVSTPAVVPLSPLNGMNGMTSSLPALPPSPRGMKGSSVSSVSSVPMMGSGLMGSGMNGSLGSSVASLPVLPPSPRGMKSSSVSSVSSVPVMGSGMMGSGMNESRVSSLPALPPSPRGMGSGLPPSPKMNGSVSSSVASLPVLPPSPRMNGSGMVGSGSMNLPTVPSSPSLKRLPGFETVPTESPLALPTIPSTGRLPTTQPSQLTDRIDGTDRKTRLGKSRSKLFRESSMKDLSMNRGREETPVEVTLLESGYVPTDKVITKDDNGLLVCQYIKAVDKSGRSVFVDMDCEGFVSVDPKSMSMSKVSSASAVPYSIKMGAYDCAASGVCGVAFEYDGEVCALKRSTNDLSPTETVFASLNKGDENYGALPNYPIPYPIVSLNEIKSNPYQVKCSIKDSHDRMRSVAFGHVARDAKALDSAMVSLHDQVKRFELNQRIVSNKLGSTLKEFETINEQFNRKPPTNDKTRALQRSVQFNLRKRNQMVEDFLKLSEAVNARATKIKELAGELKELNEYFERSFTGLDGVYQE